MKHVDSASLLSAVPLDPKVMLRKNRLLGFASSLRALADDRYQRLPAGYMRFNSDNGRTWADPESVFFPLLNRMKLEGIKPAGSIFACCTEIHFYDTDEVMAFLGVTPDEFDSLRFKGFAKRNDFAVKLELLAG